MELFLFAHGNRVYPALTYSGCGKDADAVSDAAPARNAGTLKPPTKSHVSTGSPTQTLSLRRFMKARVPNVKIPTPGGIDIVEHLDILLAAVPSMAALLLFNDVNKAFVRELFKVKKFPPPLVGMFLFFGTMLYLDGKDAAKAAKFVAFFEPAVTLLTTFL
jgi:hypothetical protein